MRIAELGGCKKNPPRWGVELFERIRNQRPVSIDFWNTLIVETKKRSEIRLMVCRQLVIEFDLGIEEKNLYEIFQRVSDGLALIASNFGFDNEFKLQSSWYYTGINFLHSPSQATSFSQRAIEIEIKYSVDHSYVPNWLKQNFNLVADNDFVFIVSDFEGSSDFLREVIRLHGLRSPKNILVSSDHLENKKSSRLFDRLRLSGYTFKDFMHFGDDQIADIAGARRAGIESVKVPRKLRKDYSPPVNPVRPSPAPSLNSDKATVTELMGLIRHELEAFLIPGDRVYFLGSEGAFFSNIELEIDDNITLACFNGGRKEILLACLESHVSWVISRFLQEKARLETISIFLGIEDIKSERFATIFNSIVNSDITLSKIIPPQRMNESQSSKQKFVRDFMIGSQEGRIVLVDVGYRGTFAQSLKILFGCEIAVFQVFGFNFELNQRGIPARTLFNEKQGFRFRNSTQLIEVLFGYGPRASNQSAELKKFQEEVLSQIQSYGWRNIRNKVLRLINWPSGELFQALSSSDHSDDLTTNNYKLLSREETLKKRITTSESSHYYFGIWGVLASYSLKKSKYLLKKLRPFEC